MLRTSQPGRTDASGPRSQGEGTSRVGHAAVREVRQAESDPPSASGRFESGVKIFGDPFLLDEESPPGRTVIVTTDSTDAPVTYLRTPNGAVEQA